MSAADRDAMSGPETRPEFDRCCTFHDSHGRTDLACGGDVADERNLSPTFLAQRLAAEIAADRPANVPGLPCETCGGLPCLEGCADAYDPRRDPGPDNGPRHRDEGHRDPHAPYCPECGQARPGATPGDACDPFPSRPGACSGTVLADSCDDGPERDDRGDLGPLPVLLDLDARCLQCGSPMIESEGWSYANLPFNDSDGPGRNYCGGCEDDDARTDWDAAAPGTEAHADLVRDWIAYRTDNGMTSLEEADDAFLDELEEQQHRAADLASRLAVQSGTLKAARTAARGRS